MNYDRWGYSDLEEKSGAKLWARMGQKEQRHEPVNFVDHWIQNFRIVPLLTIG